MVFTKLSTIGPVVSEEKMFENVDGQTDDERTTDAKNINTITVHGVKFYKFHTETMTAVGTSK